MDTLKKGFSGASNNRFSRSHNSSAAKHNKSNSTFVIKSGHRRKGSFRSHTNNNQIFADKSSFKCQRIPSPYENMVRVRGGAVRGNSRKNKNQENFIKYENLSKEEGNISNNQGNRILGNLQGIVQINFNPIISLEN